MGHEANLTLCPSDRPLDRAVLVRRIVALWDSADRHLLRCPSAMERLHRSNFDSRTTRLEAFVRPLWAVIPLLRSPDAVPNVDRITAMIAEGIAPSSPFYWGAPKSSAINSCEPDQRIVEAAALGWGLAIAPRAFWDPLSRREKSRFARWLNQIRQAKCCNNNWRYFRVFINVGLRSVGESHSWDDVVEDLQACASWKKPGGWYSDGPTSQCDYYIPWAMHLYPLLLHEMVEREPLLARFTVPAVDHARKFAPDFAAWFANNGAAVPYGRSLTYRFAQGALWAGFAWASVEVMPWGQLRQLLGQHLRWWSDKPILDGNGCITPGYAYPNPQVVESYISTASPYWAMKTLMIAGLPASHSFWRAREEPFPHHLGTLTQKTPGLIVHRHDGGEHVTALAAGQWAEWFPRHGAALYAKFAYSTAFAFSVPTGDESLGEAALDNTLAFSADGITHWHVRGNCLATGLDRHGWIRSLWRPMRSVRIISWLGVVGQWQVRVHHVITAQRVYSAEGGHAVPAPEQPIRQRRHVGGTRVACHSPGFAAGLICGLALRRAEIVLAGPNSNLMHGRTAIPTLTATLSKGSHWLVTLAPFPCVPAAFNRVWRKHAPRAKITGLGLLLLANRKPVRVFAA